MGGRVLAQRTCNKDSYYVSFVCCLVRLFILKIRSNPMIQNFKAEFDIT